MYSPPIRDILATLSYGSGLSRRISDTALTFDDVTEVIIGEAGRFASEVMAPGSQDGWGQSAQISNGEVRSPAGWKDLYKSWCDAGWLGLAVAERWGGQALPETLQAATFEMWNSAALPLIMCPTLSCGAIEAIAAHGSEDLREIYLPKMVSGQWTGTMNMTEPHAGTDLGALRCRAERVGDGAYRLFGEKIFITYGEHDLAENIVHLVLARLPDAPAGSRGLSLFLVPKFIPHANGALGERNDVFCRGLEHKLGVQSSPTCTMIYGEGNYGRAPGAVGWLIGAEHQGLACMFTMMNNARVSVGVQGVAICEAATQKALAYAFERSQGAVTGWQQPATAPIVAHPDVSRMLLKMKALTQAARAIAYDCARAIHLSHTDDANQTFWRDRAALLTPLAKSFPTDAAVEVASLGIQVHGGMGFIEETGAARFYRDARILPIYEGTNGVQAIDLVMRKLQLTSPDHLAEFWQDLMAVAEEAMGSALEACAAPLRQAINDLQQTADWLSKRVQNGTPRDALFGATDFQRMTGLTLAAAYLCKLALAPGAGPEQGALARFATQVMLPETAALARAIREGGHLVAEAGALLGYSLA